MLPNGGLSRKARGRKAPSPLARVLATITRGLPAAPICDRRAFGQLVEVFRAVLLLDELLQRLGPVAGVGVGGHELRLVAAAAGAFQDLHHADHLAGVIS